MSKKRKTREHRKKVRLARRKAQSCGPELPRVRLSFFGKARSGDQAELTLSFEGNPIPIDFEHPEKLGGISKVLRDWEKDGFPTQGEA